MNDNCPACKGTGKQWDKAIGFAYEIILITLEEYDKNRDNIDKLIDIKAELVARGLKERIKDDEDKYYNELMARFKEVVE